MTYLDDIPVFVQVGVDVRNIRQTTGPHNDGNLLIGGTIDASQSVVLEMTPQLHEIRFLESPTLGLHPILNFR